VYNEAAFQRLFFLKSLTTAASRQVFTPVHPKLKRGKTKQCIFTMHFVIEKNLQPCTASSPKPSASLHSRYAALPLQHNLKASPVL
jgi:hypothetical protein